MSSFLALDGNNEGVETFGRVSAGSQTHAERGIVVTATRQSFGSRATDPQDASQPRHYEAISGSTDYEFV